MGACEEFDPDVYNSPTDPTDGPLTLGTAGGVTTLPADGGSTLEIIARIAPEAVSLNRKIVFSTTGGTFVGAPTGGTNTGNSIEVAPDSTGTARALLRSSTVVGPVFVTAQVKQDQTLLDGTAQLRIDLVVAGPALTLATAGNVTTLPADGVSTLEIIARVAPELVRPNRKIAFSTTGGTFVGASTGGTSGTSTEVALDATGTAKALLRSSTVVGSVIVTAQIKEDQAVLSSAAELRVDLVPADPATIVRFVEATSSAPADGATASRFTVEISGSLGGGQRDVTFRTTAGSFSASTDPSQQETMVTAGSDGRASVLLYSPKQVTAARVTAEVAGFEASTDISFVTAPAERIFVTIDQFTLAQNESAMVVVTLARSIGTPSEDTVVFPVARDTTGAEFGVFTGLPLSDATGTVMLEFRPDGGGTPGRARIEVTAEGSSAVGEVQFELTAPST